MLIPLTTPSPILILNCQTRCLLIPILIPIQTPHRSMFLYLTLFHCRRRRRCRR